MGHRLLSSSADWLDSCTATAATYSEHGVTVFVVVSCLDYPLVQLTTEVGLVQLTTEVGLVQLTTEVGLVQLMTEVGLVQLMTEVGLVQLTTEVGLVWQAL